MDPRVKNRCSKNRLASSVQCPDLATNNTGSTFPCEFQIDSRELFLRIRCPSNIWDIFILKSYSSFCLTQCPVLFGTALVMCHAKKPTWLASRNRVQTHFFATAPLGTAMTASCLCLNSAPRKRKAIKATPLGEKREERGQEQNTGRSRGGSARGGGARGSGLSSRSRSVQGNRVRFMPPLPEF